MLLRNTVRRYPRFYTFAPPRPTPKSECMLRSCRRVMFVRLRVRSFAVHFVIVSK